MQAHTSLLQQTLMHVMLLSCCFLFQLATKGLLERLADGVVVGDGSFVVTLEKRGYVSIGSWTPEAAALYPEAGIGRAYSAEIPCIWVILFFRLMSG